MTGYTKLFGSIVASTIWRESKETKIVWITMLALANKDGIVEASLPGLADLSRVSVEECEVAIAKLEAPDKHSRTQAHEGRRIQKVDGGWLVLNHAKYREKMNADERREYFRLKQQEHRAKLSKTCQTPSKTVKDTQNPSIRSTQSESEAQSEADEVPPISPQGGNSVRFQKPTIESVKLQAAKSGLPDSEAERFFSYYESNGWRVGRNPMRSWPAAMVNWKKNYDERRYSSPPGRSPQDNPRNAGTCPGVTDYVAAAKRLATPVARQVALPSMSAEPPPPAT